MAAIFRDRSSCLSSCFNTVFAELEEFSHMSVDGFCPRLGPGDEEYFISDPTIVNLEDLYLEDLSVFINMISESLQEDADNVQGYQELPTLQAAIEQALLESGSSLQLLSEPSDLMVPMWPQTEEEDEVLVQVVEVITSIEDDEDEERVITDLDSHGSSADDFSDYGSESGTEQTSDMDLSQRSMELNQHLQDQLSHQLQNFQSSMRTSFEHQETLRQMGQIGGLGETMIKQETQPYYQTMLPPIKLEPGLGLGGNLVNAKEYVDYNHNEHYPMNSVKVESAYPDTQYVKMESVYPDTPGVIPSVVTSDGEEEMEDTTVDSGTESCDSKDSGSNRKGERKRPGRKKGQVSKVYHLWEFIKDMLADARFCPSVIKWENEEEGIFRVIQSEALASLWGARKKNRTKMTYEKMSRSIRYSRKEGYFADIPKNRGYPKKLCFKFGGKAHGWRQVR